MQQLLPILLGAVIALAPLGAKASDLVVWWQKGTYAQEDEALREIIAAFEQESGKQVELSFYQENEFQDKIVAALRPATRPTSPSASGVATTSPNGLSTIGLSTSRTPSVTSQTCSIRMRSLGGCD